MSTDMTNSEMRPAFEKAKSLFTLQDPAPATEEAWELYTTNRLGASQFLGINDNGAEAETDVDDDDDGDDEDEEHDALDSTTQMMGAIGGTMAMLEDEMGIKVKDNVLRKSFRVISCDAVFDEDTEPHFANVLTRIYSPTRPLYIDVHFDYSCRPGYYTVDWSYRIGFKIHMCPAKDDYRSTKPTKLGKGSPETAYNIDGWRPIAYGYDLFDEETLYGCGQKRGVEHKDIRLGISDVRDICDALWGPQKDLPEGADDETKIERRRVLVNGVRVLLAAVGIKCTIACSDKEKDAYLDFWELGGGRNWFAREIRKACGFQLERDAEEAQEEENLRRENLRREAEAYDDDDYDSEYASF